MCKLSLAIAFIFCALIQASAVADLMIDFETNTAGGTPVDNQDLILPYTDPDGVEVRFGVDTTGDGVIDIQAAFEDAVDADDPGDPEGFLNNETDNNDQAQPGSEAQLGDFFLRTDGVTSPITDTNLFVIDFTSGTHWVTSASGEIWDIDTDVGGTEQFRVTAYGFGGNILGFQDSPVGEDVNGPGIANYDGLPWLFDFTGFSEGIQRLEISFLGTKPSGVGMAFNNLEIGTAAVPEPTSLMLTGLLGVVVMGGGAVRRKLLRVRNSA